MDKPNGTYALGVFCTFVRPYVSGESRGISTQKKGFMKDFFDVILESSATDTSDVNKRHYSKAKTAINEGVWAGINQTDLVKFFNGCRKLPQWKASEFFQHLDKARVESLFDDIGIDALSQFQRCLGQVNIKAPSIDKLPSAVSTWLFEILEANADNRDLLVDGTAFQPEFELLDDLPLACRLLTALGAQRVLVVAPQSALRHQPDALEQASGFFVPCARELGENVGSVCTESVESSVSGTHLPHRRSGTV